MKEALLWYDTLRILREETDIPARLAEINNLLQPLAIALDEVETERTDENEQYLKEVVSGVRDRVVMLLKDPNGSGKHELFN